MNEQLIDKLESKCQLVETLERDLLDARKKVSQRKSSIESGSRKMSLAKSEDELDPKFSQVKNAVMKEPDMEPKTSSEIGINYIVLTYIYRKNKLLWQRLYLLPSPEFIVLVYRIKIYNGRFKTTRS